MVIEPALAAAAQRRVAVKTASLVRNILILLKRYK
jgi:hypothetical protein